MSKEASEEIREAAVAVVSAAAKATDFVRNESSDSCGIDDDKKQLLSTGNKYIASTVLKKPYLILRRWGGNSTWVPIN